jgi:hypothetical protein
LVRAAETGLEEITTVYAVVTLTERRQLEGTAFLPSVSEEGDLSYAIPPGGPG